jgi:hypothetical protein
VERGRKGVHGLLIQHTRNFNLSMFTDNSRFEICCVFAAFLQMIEVLWAVSTGKDFTDALYTTGQSTTIPAPTDTVFVPKTQCDQFITIRLKIHDVFP